MSVIVLGEQGRLLLAQTSTLFLLSRALVSLNTSVSVTVCYSTVTVWKLIPKVFVL